MLRVSEESVDRVKVQKLSLDLARQAQYRKIVPLELRLCPVREIMVHACGERGALCNGKTTVVRTPLNDDVTCGNCLRAIGKRDRMRFKPGRAAGQRILELQQETRRLRAAVAALAYAGGCAACGTMQALLALRQPGSTLLICKGCSAALVRAARQHVYAETLGAALPARRAR